MKLGLQPNILSLNILNSTFSAVDIANTHVTVDFDDDLPSTIQNSIIWSGNSATSSLAGTTSNVTIEHSLIKNENPPGVGNLDGTQVTNAPIFINPTALDFRMQDCSPTVNLGLNTFSNETTDLLGNLRIFETTIDMGAYELQSNKTTTCSVLTIPDCTSLSSPIDGANDIAIDTDISWGVVTDATRYEITINSTSGNNNITNFDNGNSTSYNPPIDFDNGDVVSVTITPYINTTPAFNCRNESFTIVSAASIVPDCTILNSPIDGANDIAVDTDISWNAVTDATRYEITISSTSGNNNITNFDNGNNTTYNPPVNFDNSDVVTVTITPLNGPLEPVTACSSESFTIESIPERPFITTWETTTANEEIFIPVFGTNYTVDWGDGDITTGETANAMHTYITPGTHTVRITGDYASIRFLGAFPNANEIANAAKIKTIEQWGDNQWASMERAFSGAVNLQGNFTDDPDLTMVTSMNRMFQGAESFNWPIDNWDVSKVENMNFMFSRALDFNQDLNSWDVSAVTTMDNMFNQTPTFNGDITNWTVTSLQDMDFMFSLAEVFNRDISGWNTASVTTMQGVFSSAFKFDQNLSSWNVASVTDANNMFNNSAL